MSADIFGLAIAMWSRRKFVAATATISVAPTLALKAMEPTEYILGLDNYGYPGDDAMKWFQEDNKRRFIGIYLTHWNQNNDVIHEDDGWIGKRNYLNGHGWGFLPTYMGKQPPGAAGPKFPVFPMPTAQEGSQNGAEAVSLMKKAGFQPGTIVYLDVEAGIAESSTYVSYIRAWQKSVAQGGFYPGVYCSYKMIPWVKNLSDAIWGFEQPAGSTVMKELDLISTLEYDPGKFPYGKIHDGAVATQYLTNKPIAGCPVQGQYDSNSSLVSDPSDLASVLQALNRPSVDLSRF